MRAHAQKQDQARARKPSIPGPQTRTRTSAVHEGFAAPGQSPEHAGHDLSRIQIHAAANPGTLFRKPLPGLGDRTPPQTARLLGSELLDGFELNGATLTDAHRGRLLALAATLKSLLQEYPSGSIQITGHTDASGQEEYNEKLGKRRADAVSDFLLEAGVPPGALAALSAGESELRVKTAKPEGLNRRVRIRFEPQPLKLGPSLSLAPPGKTEKVATPEPVPEVPKAAAPFARCDAVSNCSSVSSDPFERQPPALQATLNASALDPDPATWFKEIGDERRSGLAAIFNRLCRYGLWCHVTQVLKVVPGEARVFEAIKVPGLTPSVHFMSRSGEALIQALMDTGRFCQATGTGAKLHPGQTTLREVSTSDSLHVSVGSKSSDDEFDAHIDLHSAVPDHPGAFCSNEPTPAAVGHIGREVVPEKVRQVLKIPGVQVFPEPARPAPVPEGAVGPEPYRSSSGASLGGVIGLLIGALLENVRMTWHGPAREKKPLVPAEQKRAGDVADLAAQVVADIQRDLDQRVSPGALVPSHAKIGLAQAEKDLEFAGPDEEEARRTARDNFEALAASYADAHEVAFRLAGRMVRAQGKGERFVTLELEQYDKLSPASRAFLAGEIRRIAIILRRHLPDKAKDVHYIRVFFGSGKKADSAVIELP